MKYLQSTYTVKLTRGELSTLCDALRTRIETFKPEDYVGSDPSSDYRELYAFAVALLDGDVKNFPHGKPYGSDKEPF